MSAPTFEPIGAVSVVAACMALIQETPELEGFSYDVALTEVRARTGRADVPRRQVITGIREATERLHREGVPGVENIGKAWQRLDPKGMVRFIATRDRRGRRQFRRAVVAAAATDKSRLGFEDRHTLDHHERTARAVGSLEQRRANRLRPLPPAASE
jgi:hypothetical protein